MLGKPAMCEGNGVFVMDNGSQASIGVMGERAKTTKRVGRMPRGAEGEQNRDEGWEDEAPPQLIL